MIWEDGKRYRVVSLEINFIDYDETNEFGPIHPTNSVIIPLIYLPLSNKTDVITVDGLCQTVISQLTKPIRGIQVDGVGGGYIISQTIRLQTIRKSSSIRAYVICLLIEVNAGVLNR